MAGASEPATYTWTLAAAHGAVGAILAYTGCRHDEPDGRVERQANSGTSSVSAPSVTATGPGEQLIGLFGAKGPVSFTPPAGMSERTEISLNLSGEKVSDESADLLLGGRGSERHPRGHRTAASSASASSWRSALPRRAEPAAGRRFRRNQPDQSRHDDRADRDHRRARPRRDPLTYAYQWSRNGVDIPGASGSTLDLSVLGNGNKGDAIALRVVANDGSLQSAPLPRRRSRSSTRRRRRPSR